jgi:hypothetical protein
MDDESVFRALADPSRRRLLDLLFERDGRTLTELESMPGGVTKVTVVHEDFQGQTATYKGLQGGSWTWILSNMKTLLETGEPMPQGY